MLSFIKHVTFCWQRFFSLTMHFILFSLCFILIIVFRVLLRKVLINRSSRPEVFCEKGALKNFTKFTGKHMWQSLFFNKVVKFLRATFILNTSGRLLLNKVLLQGFFFESPIIHKASYQLVLIEYFYHVIYAFRVNLRSVSSAIVKISRNSLLESGTRSKSNLKLNSNPIVVT